MQLHLKLRILTVHAQYSILRTRDHRLSINIEQLARDAALRPDERLSRHDGREAVVIVDGALEGDVCCSLTTRPISTCEFCVVSYRGEKAGRGLKKETRTSCCWPEKK